MKPASRPRRAAPTRSAPMAVVAVVAAAGLGSSAAAGPDDVVARPLVLAADTVEARLVLEIELAVRRRGEPTSLAPDFAVGVTRDLTLGVVHSASGLSQIDAGRGFCFRGDEHGCARAYDNVALDARWSLWRGPRAVALRGRFIARSFEPWKPRIGLGAVARWSLSRFSITTDPSLSLGLVRRDRGNRAGLDLPLWIAVQPTCRWALHVRTGVHGTVATFGDSYQVPVGIGVTAAAHRHLDLGVEAAFQRLLGPQNDLKNRSMWLAATLRWP